MKNLLILVLVLSLLSVSAFTQSKPQQWEYKFVYQCDEKKANNVASDGWEMVNMSMASPNGGMAAATCAFKRAR